MRIKIVSHEVADMLVPTDPSIKALVSIHSPAASRIATFKPYLARACTGFNDFAGHKIELVFDDAVTGGRNVYPPTEGDIKTFLKWAESVPFAVPFEEKGTILFHCQAGIARSTACALAFLTMKMGDGSEQECVDHIFSVRPETWYNDLIVYLADEILGRDGRLYEAMETWKDRQRKLRGIHTLY